MRPVFFRVQDAEGRGPWRPGWSHTWLDDDAPADQWTESTLDLLPVSTLRSLPPALTCGCACRSFEGLMRWFTPREREALARLGFHPVRLHGDVVLAESERQVVIARRRPFSVGATRLRWPRCEVRSA